MIQHPLAGHGELKIFGVLVHSTGDGVPKKALANNTDVMTTAIDIYAGMAAANGVGAHYCISPDGRIVCFRQPNEISWHAGTKASERAAFLDGSWADGVLCPTAVSSWWKLRWPSYKSPQHLFPTHSPNDSYVGVELIPCGSYTGNTWAPLLGTPATPKGRYTAEQYQALALLSITLGRTYGLPDDFYNTHRMVGHEDVNPITRPGWDVGAFQGWWSWSLFRGMMQSLTAFTSGALIKL